MEIIPAILPKNFAEIEEKIELIKGISKIVQIDICDGKLTPIPTWPYAKMDENFEAIIREERGMPEWESLDYEFDLMISAPNEDDMRKWLSAGASRIILHAESGDLDECIKVISGLVEIGIAINSDTKLEKIEKYIEKINFIQCMGIKNIGKQGQKFNTKTLDKIKEIKTAYPNIKVQVDGGVTLENASVLKHAGVDRVVAGSAVFGSDNIVDTIEDFRAI